MNLEAYKKTLIAEIILHGFGALVALALFTVGFFSIKETVGIVPISVMNGYFCGILAVLLLSVSRRIRALRDKSKLEKMYVETHDERVLTIRANSGLPMAIFLSLGVMIAATVFGLLESPALFEVLVYVGVVEFIIGLASWGFWNYKL